MIPLASRNCLRYRITGLTHPKFHRISCSALGKWSDHSRPSFELEIGTKNPSFLRPSIKCLWWSSSRPFNHLDFEKFVQIPKKIKWISIFLTKSTKDSTRAKYLSLACSLQEIWIFGRCEVQEVQEVCESPESKFTEQVNLDLRNSISPFLNAICRWICKLRSFLNREYTVSKVKYPWLIFQFIIFFDSLSSSLALGNLE